MWMFNAQSETGRQCGVPQGQLLTSLTTYIELYSSQKDYLKNTTDYFSRISIQVQEQIDESKKDKTARALLGGFCGGSLGATIGIFSGGVAGGMGAVAAAALFAEDLNAVSASVGFFGGTLGGMVGASFAGMLGGAVGAAAESAGHSMDNAVYKLLWSVIGGATGTAIGHIFGGNVGTVAGAVGGGLGALCGVSGAVGLIKSVLGEFNIARQARNSQGPKKEDSMMQIFQRNTSPLIAELSVINTISSKMDTWARGVAAQSSKCLTVVSRTEKALADVQKTPQTASCLKKAAEHCIHMCEELGMMKCEAEKLLASWSKHNNTV